jgi:hypothetical protein
VIEALQTALQPLLDLYGVTSLGGRDGHGGDDASRAALRALLKDVSFTVQGGNLVVANRATGGAIYTAPLEDLTSGTFHPENLPAGLGGTPGTTCSSFTYSEWNPAVCDASGLQTRTVVTSAPSGCTGGAPVLSQACTPPFDGAALYTQSCSRCHGGLATSDLKGKGISVTSIKSFGMTQGLTDAQLQAIVTAVGP